MAKSTIELGFLEEEDHPQRLRSAFFPSKFGGVPSWLELVDIPSLEQLKCPSCSEPVKFLLQVYAPMDTEDSFHRTIFVFVCPRKMCCLERNSSKNLIVLRSQLQRENDYYSPSPPNEEDKSLESLGPLRFGVNLCKVCGIKSTQSCSKCGILYYCGKVHQTLDWKGGHKDQCGDKESLSPEPVDTYCYKEHALVIDTEVIPKQKGKDKSEKDRLAEYQELLKEGKVGTLTEDNSTQTKDMLEAASQKSDKAFNKFKKRVAYHPDQVLRYDRNGTPLWVSSDNTLDSKDVPSCPYCKGPRVFEFQIMPQLLNYVGDDSVSGDLDWGTLAVYTCQNHCKDGSKYQKEFIWRQDFSKGRDDDGDTD